MLKEAHAALMLRCCWLFAGSVPAEPHDQVSSGISAPLISVGRRASWGTSMCLPVRVITAAGRSVAPPLSISASASQQHQPRSVSFLLSSFSASCILPPLFYCFSLFTVAAAHKCPSAVTARLLTSASFSLLNIQHFLLSTIISRLKEHQIIIIKIFFITPLTFFR